MYANVLFFFPLIAHEIWTWNQGCIGFVMHKRAPGFYRTMPVLGGGTLFSHSVAACIVQLLFYCWEHIAVDNVIPEGNTAILSFLRKSWLWDAAKSCLCDCFPLSYCSQWSFYIASHLLNKAALKLFHILVFYIKRTFPCYIRPQICGKLTLL